MSDMQAFIEQAKTVSPEVSLYHYSNGTIFAKDAAMVNAVRKAGLPDEVINILISYCMLVGNSNFKHDYFITIATSLLMAKVETAEEAMKHIKRFRKLSNQIRGYFNEQTSNI
jgi:replication initiation and membrane attachment protein DnaB